MVTNTHPFHESEEQYSSCSLGTSQLKSEPRFYSLAPNSWLSRERLFKLDSSAKILIHTHIHTQCKTFFIPMTVTEIQGRKKKSSKSHSLLKLKLFVFSPVHLGQGNRLCLSCFHQSFMHLKANVISFCRHFFFRINDLWMFNFSLSLMFPSSPDWVVCSQ